MDISVTTASYHNPLNVMVDVILNPYALLRNLSHSEEWRQLST